MEMKHTQGLSVYIDNNLETGELVIHPNDGFDLGLMNDTYAVSISCNSDPARRTNPGAIPGKIHLRNSCRSGTLLVSKKQREQIGRESQVTLAIKTNRVFIIGRKAKPADA